MNSLEGHAPPHQPNRTPSQLHRNTGEEWQKQRKVIASIAPGSQGSGLVWRLDTIFGSYIMLQKRVRLELALDSVITEVLRARVLRHLANTHTQLFLVLLMSCCIRYLHNATKFIVCAGKIPCMQRATTSNASVPVAKRQRIQFEAAQTVRRADVRNMNGDRAVNINSEFQAT